MAAISACGEVVRHHLQQLLAPRGVEGGGIPHSASENGTSDRRREGDAAARRIRLVDTDDLELALLASVPAAHLAQRDQGAEAHRIARLVTGVDDHGTREAGSEIAHACGHDGELASVVVPVAPLRLQPAAVSLERGQLPTEELQSTE